MNERESEIRRQQEYVHSLLIKVQDLLARLTLSLDINESVINGKDKARKLEKDLNEFSNLLVHASSNPSNKILKEIEQRKRAILPAVEDYLSGKNVELDKYLIEAEGRKERAPLPASDLEPAWYSAEEISLANRLLAFETERIFHGGDELSSLISTDLHDIAKKDKDLEDFAKVQRAVEVVQDFLSKDDIVGEFILREKKNSGSDVISAGSEKITLVWLKEKNPEVWQAVQTIIEADTDGSWLRTVAGHPRNFADFYEVDEDFQATTKQEVAEMIPNIIALAIANSRETLRSGKVTGNFLQAEEGALKNLYGESALEEIEAERAGDIIFVEMVEKIAKELTPEQAKLWKEIAYLIRKGKISKILEYERLDDALSVWGREVGKMGERDKKEMVDKFIKLIYKVYAFPGMLQETSTLLSAVAWDTFDRTLNPISWYKSLFGKKRSSFETSALDKIEKKKRQMDNKILVPLLKRAHSFVREEISEMQKEEAQEQDFVPHPEYLKDLEFTLVKMYHQYQQDGEFLAKLQEEHLNDFSNFDLRDIDKNGPLSLKNAIMRGSNFGEAKLVNFGLSGIDLREANLRYVDFEGSFFGLRGSLNEEKIPAWIRYGIGSDDRFSKETLFNYIKGKCTRRIKLNLQGSNLEGFSISKPKYVPGIVFDDQEGMPTEIDFVFEFMNLSGSNLRGTIFIGIDFLGSNLENTDMKNSDLTNCRFFRANLKGVNFVGATLTNIDWQQAELEGARFDKDNTDIPEEIKNHLDENGIYKNVA